MHTHTQTQISNHAQRTHIKSRATHIHTLIFPTYTAGTNVTAQKCSSTATGCYSILKSVYDPATASNITTFDVPVNATWPKTFVARGCYDPSLSLYLQCPLARATHASIPTAFQATPYAVLQENTTAKSLVFYLCCNTTLCNNISANGDNASLTNGLGINDGDGKLADFLFEEGPIVKPIPGILGMMDMLMLAAIGLLGLGIGFIVDLAATGKGPFKES